MTGISIDDSVLALMLAWRLSSLSRSKCVLVDAFAGERLDHAHAGDVLLESRRSARATVIAGAAVGDLGPLGEDPDRDDHERHHRERHQRQAAAPGRA